MAEGPATVLKGSKQLTEAGWVFESVMVYHHHVGSSQAEHGRLACMKPAAIWLWIELLRETQSTSSRLKNENDMFIFAVAQHDTFTHMLDICSQKNMKHSWLRSAVLIIYCIYKLPLKIQYYC